MNTNCGENSNVQVKIQFSLKYETGESDINDLKAKHISLSLETADTMALDSSGQMFLQGLLPNLGTVVIHQKYSALGEMFRGATFRVKDDKKESLYYINEENVLILEENIFEFIADNKSSLSRSKNLDFETGYYKE